MSYAEDIRNLLLDSHEFIEENGFEGVDPRLFWYFPLAKLYDRKPGAITNFLRRAEVVSYRFFPALIEPYLKACKIPKVISPYGLGVLIQAYIRMSKALGDSSYLDYAIQYADLLEKMLSPTRSGGLGVPNPLEDPRVVNLPAGSEVAHGFLDLYDGTGREHYLDIARRIADSFFIDFCAKKISSSEVVLDYTSDNDGTHVLNANALAISVMARVGDRVAVSKYNPLVFGVTEYIKKYLRFRYLPYTGEEDSRRTKSWWSYDCYHAGFTLRAMAIVENYNRDVELYGLIKKSLSHYRKDFLRKDGCVKVYTHRRVVDIHGVAEYIRTISELDFKASDADVFMKNISYMRKGGTFYYQRGWRDIYLYMPRWGHAPMMLALSQFLVSTQQK